MSRRSALINTIITALVIISLSLVAKLALGDSSIKNTVLNVGFIYESDESTPYTYNFIRAEKALKEKYPQNINVIVKSNVSYDMAYDALEELVDAGCSIIFTTSYGYGEFAKKAAQEHPNIQFCQATCDNSDDEPVLENYHTFMGEIYQGRYVAGVAAGMKLRQLIDEGTITPDEAVAGYVAAYPVPEVISGYTAFLMGIRSQAPETTMRVKYTYTWSNYSIEKQYAQDLIDQGCILISQHSDTIGPAVACEEYNGKNKVYHIGYNQSMTDFAPTTSIISTRINWTPYVISAVEAVMEGRRVEDNIKGHIHGTDAGAGFEQNWVQMLELNSHIAAPGTRETMDHVISDLKSGRITVFKGSYTGKNVFDPADTIDLTEGYEENRDQSAPSFCYILDDVITIEED